MEFSAKTLITLLLILTGAVGCSDPEKKSDELKNKPENTATDSDGSEDPLKNEDTPSDETAKKSESDAEPLLDVVLKNAGFKESEAMSIDAYLELTLKQGGDTYAVINTVPGTIFGIKENSKVTDYNPTFEIIEHDGTKKELFSGGSYVTKHSDTYVIIGGGSNFQGGTIAISFVASKDAISIQPGIRVTLTEGFQAFVFTVTSPGNYKAIPDGRFLEKDSGKVPDLDQNEADYPSILETGSYYITTWSTGSETTMELKKY